MPDVVKVTLNNETLIDISDSTVDSSKVLSSYVGYEGDGDRFVGAYTPPASVTVEPLSATQNTTYTAPSGTAYSPVTVNVPTVTAQALSVTSNGTYTAPTGTAYTPVTVNVEGGGSSSEGGVKFIDYDGAVLHEYTVEEFSELSALPANPTHTGLTSQGWNWTKAQIDAKLEDYPEASVIVGQMYITDDGKTRLYCTFDNEERLSPEISLGVNGEVTIDWGDNSSTDTLTGSTVNTFQSAQHTYATTGSYLITLTVNNGTIKIHGTNSQATKIMHKQGGSSSNSGIVYSKCINKVEVGSNTSIGTAAFFYCTGLKTITMPEGAFSNNDAHHFSQCYELSSITIPTGGAQISISSFYCCYKLSYLSIPYDASYRSDSTYVFNYCYALSSVNIPEGATSISNNVFQYCGKLSSVNIPEGVTSIGSSAFAGCYTLPSITIPSTVTSIGSNVFQYCYKLSSVNIPEGVTSINSSVFQNCYTLSSVNIPEGVTSIGNNAFQNCYTLSSLTIPSTVTSIGSNAFQSCYVLSSVNIPEGVTSINGYTFHSCVSLSSITIPSTVTSIGNNAFQNCYTLSSITIPSTVTSIGNNVFQNCYTLSSLTIPSTVTSIGTYVFQNCYTLSSLTIPSTVTSIGTYAFQNCYGMKEYHLLPTTPPTLAGTNAFTNIQSDCVIYVPAESLEAYQTATNWSTYASYMQGE